MQSFADCIWFSNVVNDYLIENFTIITIVKLPGDSQQIVSTVGSVQHDFCMLLSEDIGQQEDNIANKRQKRNMVTSEG